jgi:hypothetical protein
MGRAKRPLLIACYHGDGDLEEPGEQVRGDLDPRGQKSPEFNRRKRFDLCFQLAAGMGPLKRRYAVSLAALLICTICFLLFRLTLSVPYLLLNQSLITCLDRCINGWIH